MRDVSVLSVPDRTERVILSGILNGAISPDGTQALYLQRDGLHFLDPAASIALSPSLTDEGKPVNPDGCEIPNWSPSSTMAAIACQPLLSDSYPAVFLFESRSQHLEALAVGLRCFFPDWSSGEDALTADCWTEFSHQITVLPRNGVPYPAFPCPVPLMCNRPAWSPDGSHLSFFAGEGRSGVPTLPYGVHITTAACIIDNSKCVHDTIGPFAASEDWDWSPDGSRIAYVVNGDVWIYDLATDTSTDFHRSTRHITGIKWSPDGQWLALEDFTSISVVSFAGLPPQSILGESIQLQEWISISGSG